MASEVETAIQDFEEGVAAFESGNHSAALHRLRPLAEQGYAPAQYYIGVMYASGFGTSADDYEAMKWFLAAAEQGVPASQTAAAEMYLEGRGAAQDYAEALKWARQAAKKGFPPAQSLIGTMYAMGTGVLQDYEEAVNWTRSAAKQGYLTQYARLRESRSEST